MGVCTISRVQLCLPGSSIHGILQATILEWVGIPFSRASSHSRDQSWVSCIAGADSLLSEPSGKPAIRLPLIHLDFPTV